MPSALVEQRLQRALEDRQFRALPLSPSTIRRGHSFARHLPFDRCGVMIAHAAPAPGGERAVLGITYDHRLLSGFDAVRLLKELVRPGNYDA